MRIQALVCLFVVVFASSLIRRPPPSSSAETNAEMKAEVVGVGEIEGGDQQQQTSNNQPKSFTQTLSFIKVLKTSPYIHLLLFKFCSAFGYLNFFVHLPVFAIEDIELSASSSAFCLALVGAASLCGRILLGIVADRVGAKKTLVLSMSGVICCVALWPTCKSLYPLALICTTFGFFAGAFPSLPPTVLSSYYGGTSPDSIHRLIGMTFLVETAGALLGPYITGVLYEVRGNYWYGSWFTCGMLGVGLFFLWRMESHEVFHERRRKEFESGEGEVVEGVEMQKV